MEMMDIPVTQLPPGDPRLVEAIVGQLKSKGIFDQFRKECLADVDTKPAFQNLRQRVEGQVNKYLDKQIWRNDMNKNQVRDGVRKHVNELGILESGIDAIITQVVNPKIKPLILPYVEDTVYTFLQIDKPKRGIIEPEPLNQPVNQPQIIEYSHGNGPEHKAALLPTDTEMVSSEEDEILARESPPSSRYTAKRPQEIKNEDENARDGFGMDTDPPAIDVQDIIASNVEKLKLEDTYEESGHLPSNAGSTKPPLQLFDNQSLDSISSNSSGLSSPKAKQSSPAEKQSKPGEISSRHEESMEDEPLSRSSTPLVDEKRVGVMDEASHSLISSGPSHAGSPTHASIDKITASPRSVPGEASPAHSAASNAIPEKDNMTFLSGASPISQDEDSRISGGSFSRVSVASEKTDVEETIKSEKSEGEITSSSSESGESDTKSRLSEKTETEDKPNEVKDGSHDAKSSLSEKNETEEKTIEEREGSQKLEDRESSHKSSSKSSSKDHKHGHRSHSREREKDRDKDSSRHSKDKDKERKSSKSRDDHHSHRDKDKKHHRKDKDHDGDRDKSHHHSSSSSSHREGSGSSSSKSGDKDKSSHKSSGDKSEGQSKRESSHEKSDRKHSSSNRSSDSKSSDKKNSSDKHSSSKHRRDSKDERSKSHRDHHRHDSKERKTKKDGDISKERSNSSSRHESKSSSSKSSKSNSSGSSSSSSSNHRKHSSDSRRSQSRSITKEKEPTVVANSNTTDKPCETSATLMEIENSISDIKMFDDIAENSNNVEDNSGSKSNNEITKDANMNIKPYGKGKIILFHCGEENSRKSNSNTETELMETDSETNECKENDFEGFEIYDTKFNYYDHFDNIVPDFEGFENILTDKTSLKMIICEKDLQGKVTMEDFLQCCINLGAVVSDVEETSSKDVTQTLQMKPFVRGVVGGEVLYKTEERAQSIGKKRRYSASSSASSSQSPTGSPKHKRTKLNAVTQLVENNQVIVSGYALLTPEDDGNRTSSRDYEVDYSQRENSYSPLSPASDSSADDGKPKQADISSEESDLKNPVAKNPVPQESLKSPKTFKNRGKVIIPI